MYFYHLRKRQILVFAPAEKKHDVDGFLFFRVKIQQKLIVPAR